MNRRWTIGELAAVSLIGLIGLIGLSCAPLSGPSPRDVEPVRRFGEEALVIDDVGSLSDLRPTTDQGRADALTQYLQENRSTFGAGDVGASALEFTSAIPQVVAGRSDGASFAMVIVQQTHQGATVIDEFQYAAFRKDTSTGDLLQRVRGRLRDPALLPTPPTADAASLRAARQMAESLAAEHGFSPDNWTLRETPVISARLGVAGYLVRHFQSNENGSFSSFTAIVSPGTGLVSVLVDQSACDAGKSWPGGQ